MFEFSLSKQQLLPHWLMVASVVDKKQAKPILSNLLLNLGKDHLQLTATDLDLEISGRLSCINPGSLGSVTVPAKKIIDIVRSLDDDAHPSISFQPGLLTLKEGRGLFKLATLPADEYPCSADEVSEVEFSLPRLALIRLLQSTLFAMSLQDVRVFLNGLLIDLDPQAITAVATDGHRMAVCRHRRVHLGDQHRRRACALRPPIR